MRNKFEEKLLDLNNLLISMGGMVEKSINNAHKALITSDIELAHEIIIAEEDVNQIEKDIESLCMKLLLQQQPVAKDLRLISATLKMITDMERIGDQSADIANIIIDLNQLGELKYIETLTNIPKMANEVSQMVVKSVNSYIARSVDMAYEVIASDKIINDLFKKAKIKLMKIIREENTDGEEVIGLLMIAKYLERIGDHSKNIAEWVIYSITGQHKKHNLF